MTVVKYDDRLHGYWIDGHRCKSITTVAKIPDDTYNLDQWRKREVVRGIAFEPALIERAAAHHDDRDQLNRIAEEALAVAKTHHKAERGTAAHRITERVDLGELIIDTPLARAVQTAWTKALDAAGLTILPEYVERIVVYPDRKIAGRFDRIARRRSDHQLVVVDLKTGTGAIRYPHSTAIQLAMYANAPLLVGPLEDGVATSTEKMPDVDKRWAYIIHMPSDAVVAVHKIDIRAGWEICRRAIFPILEWRNNRQLTRDIGSTPVTLPHLIASADRIEWIRERLGVLRPDPRARDLVILNWPSGVSPKPPWSDGDIEQLDHTLTSVETAVSASFPPADPAVQNMGAA